MRDRILRAAQTLSKTRGFDAEITEIARAAEVSTSTIYRYFASREDVLSALLTQIADRARAGGLDVYAMEDADAALRAWMRCGFSLVEEYELLALLIAAGVIPSWARHACPVDEMYEFTQHLIERWRGAGFCRPDLDLVAARRIWFALASPARVIGCMRDGASAQRVAEETFELFERCVHR